MLNSKKAGEFYTPACVVKTLVSVLKPFDGRVYDPCCGSGGMFVQSKQFVDNHQGNIDNLSVFGQESNPTTWKMAKMNLAIRGIEADLGDHQEDTFINVCLVEQMSLLFFCFNSYIPRIFYCTNY